MANGERRYWHIVICDLPPGICIFVTILVIIISILCCNIGKNTERSTSPKPGPTVETEQCSYGSWITPDRSGLTRAFNSKLHGQHMIPEKVVRSVMGHLEDEDPSKALVLSFHGWTGTGKNYVSHMIVESLYKKGYKSQYVKLFVPSSHFIHKNMVPQYKDGLRNDIISRVKKCQRSMFIFDEIDEMPEGLLDTIKPFIDFHHEVDGVDFRKTIFILLSNQAGSDIADAVIEMEKKGIQRELLELADMEKVIIESAFNKAGGFRQSSVIDKNLVSAFLPFLPLEEKHVLLCIKDEINNMGHLYSHKIANQILNELPWFPKDTRRFSETGCKQIAAKVKSYFG